MTATHRSANCGCARHAVVADDGGAVRCRRNPTDRNRPAECGRATSRTPSWPAFGRPANGMCVHQFSPPLSRAGILRLLHYQPNERSFRLMMHSSRMRNPDIRKARSAQSDRRPNVSNARRAPAPSKHSRWRTKGPRRSCRSPGFPGRAGPAGERPFAFGGADGKEYQARRGHGHTEAVGQQVAGQRHRPHSTNAAAVLSAARIGDLMAGDRPYSSTAMVLAQRSSSAVMTSTMRSSSSPEKPLRAKIWRISSRSPFGSTAICFRSIVEQALIIVHLGLGGAVIAGTHGKSVGDQVRQASTRTTLPGISAPTTPATMAKVVIVPSIPP